MFCNSFVRGVIVCSAVLFGTFAGFGQGTESPWSSRLTFDPIVTGFKKNTNDFSVGMSFYRSIYGDLDLTLGFRIQEGWNFKAAPGVPLFTGLHFDKKANNFSPVFDLETGVGVALNDLDYSNYFVNPMVGIRLGRWGVGVGYYGSQALGVEGAKWSSSLNLKLSYYFINRNGNNDYTKFIEYLRSTNFSVSLGYNIASADKDYFPENMSTVGINLAWLFPVAKNFEMGPTVGVNLSVGADVDFIYFPVALRSRYSIRQATFASKFYPYVQLDLGGAFRDGGDYKVSSFMARPAVGLSMDLRGGKSALDLSVSYSSIDAESTHSYKNDEKKHAVNNIGIALGYTF